MQKEAHKRLLSLGGDDAGPIDTNPSGASRIVTLSGTLDRIGYRAGDASLRPPYDVGLGWGPALASIGGRCWRRCRLALIKKVKLESPARPSTSGNGQYTAKPEQAQKRSLLQARSQGGTEGRGRYETRGRGSHRVPEQDATPGLLDWSWQHRSSWKWNIVISVVFEKLVSISLDLREAPSAKLTCMGPGRCSANQPLHLTRIDSPPTVVDGV
ncbi:MAG: hypothetical protein M1820_001492 [Bogoriella megaspora]|nr:MAG: hypothetical protein M1820_001492 [Bogoriella megaspora]